MNPTCKICKCKIYVLDIENQDAYKAVNPRTKRVAWMHRECHVIEDEEQIFKQKYDANK